MIYYDGMTGMKSRKTSINKYIINTNHIFLIKEH
jgi:hypothetical protein